MKIAIIGYGKEGQANETYFRQPEHGGENNEIKVIKTYRDEDYEKYNFKQYDLVLRSPSVRPRPEFSSGTRYFFEHCPAPIIGVTGTKGKGTTCSMIRDILLALGYKVWLVGNIGVPAIGELDKIRKDDVVVYELSSFQLWDLTKSPHVAVVLKIAPDHLNVHKDFQEYVGAKSHIAEFQGLEDSVVYFADDPESTKIAEKSMGRKIPYWAGVKLGSGADRDGSGTEAEKNRGGSGVESVGVEKGNPGVKTEESRESREADEKMEALMEALKVPGWHNRQNAQVAMRAVAAFLGVSWEKLVTEHFDELHDAIENFQGLPHHTELVRELNGVSYYDDSFSTAEPALEVAMQAFGERPIVLIAGGQDKGVDLTRIKQIIFGNEQLEKAFLMGEIAKKLAAGEVAEKYEIVGSLTEAVEKAQKKAEELVESSHPVVLLSPGAASLDMFKSYYERGEIFQKLVRELR